MQPGGHVTSYFVWQKHDVSRTSDARCLPGRGAVLTLKSLEDVVGLEDDDQACKRPNPSCSGKTKTHGWVRLPSHFPGQLSARPVGHPASHPTRSDAVRPARTRRVGRADGHRGQPVVFREDDGGGEGCARCARVLFFLPGLVRPSRLHPHSWGGRGCPCTSQGSHPQGPLATHPATRPDVVCLKHDGNHFGRLAG